MSLTMLRDNLISLVKANKSVGTHQLHFKEFYFFMHVSEFEFLLKN